MHDTLLDKKLTYVLVNSYGRIDWSEDIYGLDVLTGLCVRGF